MILSRNARPEASFKRQQSLLMQCRDWESRAQPYRGWGRDFGLAIVVALFVLPPLILACVALIDGWNVARFFN